MNIFTLTAIIEFFDKNIFVNLIDTQLRELGNNSSYIPTIAIATKYCTKSISRII